MSVGNKSVGKNASRLRNLVGPPVQGEDFWGRAAELEQFVELLEGGENIALVAPRRVGKTSLMRGCDNGSFQFESCYVRDWWRSRHGATFTPPDEGGS